MTYNKRKSISLPFIDGLNDKDRRNDDICSVSNDSGDDINRLGAIVDSIRKM